MTDSVKITTSNSHFNMDSGDLLLASNNNLKLIPKMNEGDCNMNMSNSVENTCVKPKPFKSYTIEQYNKMKKKELYEIYTDRIEQFNYLHNRCIKQSAASFYNKTELKNQIFMWDEHITDVLNGNVLLKYWAIQGKTPTLD